MLIQRILCVFAFALAASVASAQQAPARTGKAPDPASLTEAQIAAVQLPQALGQLASIYKKGGDLQRLAWTLKRLTELQPNSGDIKLALAATYALQDDKTRTYDTLLEMHKQGFGYDLKDNPDFAKVRGTGAWTYTLQNLAGNLQPFGEGGVAYTLPGGDHLYETLVWDPQRKQLLVGSVRDGTIQRVGKDGQLTDFIAPDATNGMWSVYAMAAVPEDDVLYVASTASVYFKGFNQSDFGKAGVFKFRLSDGKLLDKYLLAPDGQPRTLSSIAAGKDGLVFAADGLRSMIYRLDGGSLKPMVGNPKLTSIRGLALSADARSLYFVDYALGVFGVDLVAGKGFDLKYDPAKLVLGGIDGLYWYDGTLVVIENGMSPQRVMRLHLSEDGHSIVRAIPLDVANPAFALPTWGTLAGDNLYFIANSQKNKYGAYGTPKDDAKLEPVRIFRSQLRFAWDGEGISMPQATPKLISVSKPGAGKFGNVDGGSNSVSGD
jgi:sugar lactone lactonase YvrE